MKDSSWTLFNIAFIWLQSALGVEWYWHIVGKAKCHRRLLVSWASTISRCSPGQGPLATNLASFCHLPFVCEFSFLDIMSEHELSKFAVCKKCCKSGSWTKEEKLQLIFQAWDFFLFCFYLLVSNRVRTSLKIIRRRPFFVFFVEKNPNRSSWQRGGLQGDNFDSSLAPGRKCVFDAGFGQISKIPGSLQWRG